MPDGIMSLATGMINKTYVSQAFHAVECTLADSAAALRLWLLIAIATLLAASPAFAEVPPRVRGIVTGVDSGSITVKERVGGSVTLRTGAGTTYAYVVPSSLDAIEINDFVGAAVKGPLAAMVAVELVIIPESMRAGRISHYGWDPLPDPSDAHASCTTETSMTNGIVSAEESGLSGRMLTVTYDGIRSFRITVPPTAPIVRFEVTDRLAVARGSDVFNKTGPADQAALVAVGKGVTPPM